MRKQTKVVAVASAAALLAIGGAMTSFAAQGWVEEDGTWYYYDKDGNRVEDEWRKSGDNWFWLDSEEGGAMATDKLVDDDDDTYYVDANGVMVTNTWVKVVNEDQDDDEDPAEYHYYYMQSNGKAYKGTSDTIKKRTIDGKQYAFDDEGVMVYSWVGGSGERLTGDTGWKDAGTEENVYYFGSWEDGSMKTGWQKISVYDDSDNKEDDYDYWFNFKSNGRLRKNDDDWKSNGKHYRFNEYGVMEYQWSLASGGNMVSTADWSYFNSPEDGARVTKGWFKVIAPNEDNTFAESDDITFASKDADEENERWYYSNGDGEVLSGQIKKINGKYYAFRPEGNKAGAMLTGLCALRPNGDEITEVIDDDMDSDALDDFLDAEGDYAGVDYTNVSLYYFGNDADTDGAMKTGSVTINLDGDSYQFMFSKTGGAENRGKGLTGIYDGDYIYKYGKRIKADSDEKYIVVYATGTTTDDDVTVTEIDSADLRKYSVNEDTVINKDGDTIKYVGEEGKAWDGEYYLVNTSGAIQKSKTAAKDGDDWYFYVENYRIVLYANNKTFDGDAKDFLDGWKDWVDADEAYTPTH